MTDNAAEAILDDMEKQGFPLEIRVTEMLKAHGWSVYNQEPYFDRNTNKQRTIDIEGIRSIDLPKGEWVFQVRLIIECKKCSKPWVFYVSDISRDEIRNELPFYTKIYSDSSNQLDFPKNQIQTDDYVPQILFKKELEQLIFEKLARIAYEPFTDGKGNSIRRARTQVCNAIIDLKRDLAQSMGVEIPHYMLFKPIIILDGQLYTYQEENLIKKKGLYYYVRFYDETFIIEVVTIGFLNEYLTKIENNINNFLRTQEARTLQAIETKKAAN
ncbi:MAG: hypothetical protein ABSB89_06990 [Candidatus Bathyarchaeia archaeon]|jgi:hypothetical protein